ncbi:MAG: hypothetical protein AAFQ67_00385 [Pseudomonadota bacterium]
MLFSVSILAGILTVITAPGLVAQALEGRKSRREGVAEEADA